MRAFLKNYRQAPRKVRLIARTFIGKDVHTAMSELEFIPNKAAKALRAVIGSAASNARQSDASVQDEELIIKNITVDKGTTYVRYMPRAFGRAAPIKKENSHVRVVLATKKEEKTFVTTGETASDTGTAKQETKSRNGAAAKKNVTAKKTKKDTVRKKVNNKK